MCNKIGYGSAELARKDAKIILADMARLRKMKQKTKKLNEYHCWYCGMWHLTSQKRRRKS